MSTGNEFVRAMLQEQRRRLVGSIMEYAETNVFPHLEDYEQRAFRKKVMQSVGIYHDTVLDMVKASVNDGFVLNEAALEAIERMHSDVRAVRKAVSG